MIYRDILQVFEKRKEKRRQDRLSAIGYDSPHISVRKLNLDGRLLHFADQGPEVA
jgi:hypothetical protein